jgi:hypothetical protein
LVKRTLSNFELEELPPDQLNAAARLRIHPDDLSILDESDKIMMGNRNDFQNYRKATSKLIE